MTTNKEVEAFLEHFGKKGMKWGVRNDASGSASKPKQTYDDQVRAQRKKMLATTGATVAVIAGGMFAAHLIATRNKPNASNTIAFEKHMRAAAKFQQTLNNRSVPKVRPPIPKISPEAAKWKSDFSSKMRESVKLANEDLKNSYNRTDTPIPLREYITTEW